MGVCRYLSRARLLSLPRQALPLPQPAARACSTGVIRSPFPDVTIPEISITKYLFDAQEQYAAKPAMVSTAAGRLMEEHTAVGSCKGTETHAAGHN